MLCFAKHAATAERYSRSQTVEVGWASWVAIGVFGVIVGEVAARAKRGSASVRCSHIESFSSRFE
jgi:hypothetical protein